MRISDGSSDVCSSDLVILDIGSGTGNLALAIARHSRDVRYLGFDPDEAATRIARTKTAQIVPPPEFRVGFFAASAIDDWPSPSKIAIDRKSTRLNSSH